MKNIEYFKLAEELLQYHPDTGDLTWKVDRHRVKAGDVAGSLQHTGYRRVSIYMNGKRKLLAAHRIVFFIHHRFLPEEVDHIDRNTLNNRVENLRGCTHKQNTRNKSSTKGSTSKYLGVYWHKATKKWSAKITFNGETKHLGVFTDEEEAAKSYDTAAKAHFGEFANLNFK